MRVLIFILICISYQDVIAQSKSIEFQTDNDVYTFKSTRDEYYTNGFYFRYRHIVNNKKRDEKSAKLIHSYHLNQRIFTSDTITRNDLSKLDRPYAGQLSASFSKEYYYPNNSYLLAKLELGWMGPSLKTKEFQHYWHGVIGLYKPRGWNSEINDTPIINLYGSYAKSLVEKEKFELISESRLALGTAFNYANQAILFRYGKKRTLATTSLYGGNLNEPNSDKKLQEFYFLISPSTEYVFYNSTIDGNFIGTPSVLTFNSINWVFINRIGLILSWKKFDLNVIHYYKSIETPKGRDHQYVAIIFKLKL